MNRTNIEWTDTTWNPLRGCSKVSAGCANCYAETMAARFSGPGMPYEGLTERGQWTGEVQLVPKHLADPLRWREPRMIFVNSMSDMFHESVELDWIVRILAVAVCAPQHTFQILTKRAARMREIMSDPELPRLIARAAVFMEPINNRMQDALVRSVMWGPEGATGYHPMGLDPWPLPNVWLGVSCEDQRAADERIPHLLSTPAAGRFVSLEPLLGPIDLAGGADSSDWLGDQHDDSPDEDGIDWVIVGGESGRNARPCEVSWIRSIAGQCRDASVPLFCKQMGSVVRLDDDDESWPDGTRIEGTCQRYAMLRSRKGGDMSEWPEGLRVREFPR